MQKFTKSFKIHNPYRADEMIRQEVLISDGPQYDYSEVEWVAIDTEFLDLRLAYDRLCVIQIASPDPENADIQRVEIIWVWEKLLQNVANATIELIKSFLQNEALEILMHVSTADLTRLEKLTDTTTKAQVFDTKIAGKLVLTNQDRHGMDDLITSLVNPKFNKDKGVTFSQWDLDPSVWSDKMIEYAMNDVVFLHPLKQALMRIADRRNLRELVESTMSIIPQVSKLYLAGYDEKVLSY